MRMEKLKAKEKSLKISIRVFSLILQCWKRERHETYIFPLSHSASASVWHSNEPSLTSPSHNYFSYKHIACKSCAVALKRTPMWIRTKTNDSWESSRVIFSVGAEWEEIFEYKNSLTHITPRPNEGEEYVGSLSSRMKWIKSRVAQSSGFWLTPIKIVNFSLFSSSICLNLTRARTTDNVEVFVLQMIMLIQIASSSPLARSRSLIVDSSIALLSKRFSLRPP